MHKTPLHKMIVMAKATPGNTEALARWYDEQHIPDLLSVPGVVSIERHAITPLKAPSDTPVWDMLVIYELAGEDPMLAVRAMGAKQAAGGIVWSDALAQEKTVSFVAVSAGKRDSTK